MPLNYEHRALNKARADHRHAARQYADAFDDYASMPTEDNTRKLARTSKALEDAATKVVVARMRLVIDPLPRVNRNKGGAK